MKHYFFRVWTGPTSVKRAADLLRLHFANCEILEGTERVWVHVYANHWQDVRRHLAGLPQWLKPIYINEFQTGEFYDV